MSHLSRLDRAGAAEASEAGALLQLLLLANGPAAMSGAMRTVLCALHGLGGIERVGAGQVSSLVRRTAGVEGRASSPMATCLRLGALGPLLDEKVKSKPHDDAVGLWAVTETGGIDPVSKPALNPPPVQSSQQFCMALVMMQWCALAHASPVQESKFNSWAVARDYVERVLTKRDDAPKERKFLLE